MEAIVPTGYKKTKVGIIPTDWNLYRIDEVLKRVRKPLEVKPDENYQEIGIRSHGKGLFYKKFTTIDEIGDKSVFWIEPDCFIVNIVFAWEQAIGKTTVNEIGMIASHRFPMYKPQKNVLDLDYLVYLFKSKRGKYLLELASPGGAGRNKTLGQGEFAELKIPLPSYQEQQKIAQILATWDEAIIKQEELIKEKEQSKKGLMQKLLSGEVRFDGFTDEWEEVRLGETCDCLDNMRKPLNDEERQKLQGNIPYWGANNIMDYINNYIFDETIVLLAEDGGNFNEYNTRPIANISYGKCWVNNHTHVLRGKKNILINEFLFYSLVHKNITGYVGGGTRSKLTKSEMLKIQILMPSLPEQQKIAEGLSLADAEINLLKNELQELKQQKKGLMQKLLTGEVRVKV
ncbi:restriction endonuclease subunit S [Sulfuricurvum sp.]|uniref:restriction endonuclease subunit S n=1 Tax=Sulfuricurvum sp. TaxID=2025608 RepID=UPI0026148B76|nr:restriction endonuclease subunit S [Sulfuricurvum sp.]MDD4950709.1 restriction endonuclease subunit S [Sulfuricurvum sp.]